MWYYAKSGMQMGPVSGEELASKAASGEVSPSDLIWREGMGDWLPLSQVPEFAAGLTPSAPPAPPTGQTGGSVPLPQPPAYHGNYVAPNIPTYMTPSIIALVMWCASMALICIPIGLPVAIVAVVYATRVDSLRAQGDLVSAQAASRNAKIWMIVAYATFGLPVIGAIGFLVIVTLNGGAGP
jgi:hypothetical protein